MISARRWRARWWVLYFPGFAYRRVIKCKFSQHVGPFHDGVVCLSCGTEWDHIRRKWCWFNVPEWKSQS